MTITAYSKAVDVYATTLYTKNFEDFKWFFQKRTSARSRHSYCILLL